MTDAAASVLPEALDAERLYRDLLVGVRKLLTPGAALVGIRSGGAWLAERLHAELGLEGEPGIISSTLHRDDYSRRGLAGSAEPTRLLFAVDGCHIVLVDDVLYTGRTIRAALNELYDFGRPASVRLAVMIDRGGRELPIEADLAVARVELSPSQRLSLERSAAGSLRFEIS